MSDASPVLTFSDELACVNTCMARYSDAYQAFMASAQAFQWVAAGAHQDQASGYMEAAMDAYMRACRLQEAMKRG